MEYKILLVIIISILLYLITDNLIEIIYHLNKYIKYVFIDLYMV